MRDQGSVHRARRIALITYSLWPGGAERVLSMLAGLWQESGKQVTLITLASSDTDFFRVSPGVRRIGLGLLRGSTPFWRLPALALQRRRAIRGAIRSSAADVVVSFLDGVNLETLIAARGMGIPVVVSERAAPGEHVFGWWREQLRRWLYPRAAAVVVQTRGALEWMQEQIPQARTLVIPNPVFPPAPQAASPRANTPPTILGIGRLVPQKGFDLLLAAFARVASEQPSWRLRIAGDGPERSALERLATELGVGDRVDLVGVQPQQALFDHGDLFVLPSRYEGFPNALLEAMSRGLAVLSCDCPYGPREIIRSGVDGVLVEAKNVDALTAALRTLMSSSEERARLAARAPEVLTRFSPESVLAAWEDVLATAGSGTPVRS